MQIISLLSRDFVKGVFLAVLIISGFSVSAQVTTSTISGIVVDAKGEPLIGVTVLAVHVPSGSKYGTTTNASGRYTLPAVRVGGPFTISTSYTGFEAQSQTGIFTSLGTAANVNFGMVESGITLSESTIVAQRSDIFSSDRTGAASTFDKKILTTVPVIGSRSINDITKYNPNGNGRSFGGQDSRLNNFTIDGSVFNNGFGLGSDAQAGGRTGSTAISLDAIEEVQVNVAPFDVRQTGFVGSGINAVTRSGTNEYVGSVYYTTRDNSSTFYGKKANGTPVTVGTFKENVTGIRIGGPIIKDKLFFFVNGEIVRKTEPATPYVADGSSNAGTKTRVLKSDLEELSSFLDTKYGYKTGAYENFDNETTSDKFLVRLDYNISNAHKLSLRYTNHNSSADVMISNSASAGAGFRRSNLESMAYQNSGYLIGDQTRSVVAELNSTISDKFHNNFLVGYDYQNEDRQYKSPTIFPTVDILKDGKTYISTGFDPFTPNNLLDYGTFHATNNLSIYLNKHTITLGANYERYKSNNSFFPASNGVYVFNSLQDFYAAANATADTSPVKINTFQYRYSALENGELPLQVLKVNKFDLYGQDEIQVTKNFKLLAGLRLGAISFVQTGLENKIISGLDFVDEEGNRGYKINTSQLPETKILFEPRLGFNWDVTGKKKTQLRGGTGIFTGRPPYVWVSNQIGNNGVLTGFIQGRNTTAYKFTPDASVFTPDMPTAPSSYDIAATDPSYNFPQIWKTNIALDQKLGLGLVGSVELLYNQNINAVKYWDANLESPANGASFTGPDTRDRFPASGLTGSAAGPAVLINDNVSRAAIMTTTNQGYYYGATFKLEYPNQKGLYGMFAYTLSEAKDLMSAGSIASGSWTAVKTVNGNNNLSLSYADADLPNRLVGLLGYRVEYFREHFATAVTLGYVGEQSGRYSFSIAGDMNGDGVRDNELLYVPTNGSDLKFKSIDIKDASGAIIKTFTEADQQAAFDKFIDQDPYLSTRRGQYAERNGALLPWLHRFDLSVVQDLGIKIKGKRNAIQLRFDILNFGNMLSDKFGVGNIKVTERPLTFSSVGTDGVPVYQMATQKVGSETLLLQNSLLKSAQPTDVWSAQFGIRYLFNN